MLYQMLTGELPFNAPSIPELIQQQMTAMPPPIRRLRPELPVGVEQLVSCMLSKDPAHRPQRASKAARANLNIDFEGVSNPTYKIGGVRNFEILNPTFYGSQH
jgi:serine/threonine protein kinase